MRKGFIRAEVGVEQDGEESLVARCAARMGKTCGREDKPEVECETWPRLGARAHARRLQAVAREQLLEAGVRRRCCDTDVWDRLIFFNLNRKSDLQRIDSFQTQASKLVKIWRKIPGNRILCKEQLLLLELYLILHGF
jgi:hypothetical protein